MNMESMRKHFRFPLFDDETGVKTTESSSTHQLSQQKHQAAVYGKKPFMERSMVVPKEQPSKLDVKPIEMDVIQSYDEPITEEKEVAAINKKASSQYETAFQKKVHRDDETNVKDIKQETQTSMNPHTNAEDVKQTSKLSKYQSFANPKAEVDENDETSEMLQVKKQMRHLKEEREDIPFRRKQRHHK